MVVERNKIFNLLQWGGLSFHLWVPVVSYVLFSGCRTSRLRGGVGECEYTVQRRCRGGGGGALVYDLWWVCFSFKSQEFLFCTYYGRVHPLSPLDKVSRLEILSPPFWIRASISRRRHRRMDSCFGCAMSLSVKHIMGENAFVFEPPFPSKTHILL